jgi:hypothetical protein
LYLTPNGSWFLHKEGGALSYLGEFRGEEPCASEDISLMSAERAYEWLASKKEYEAIERYFADRLTDT